MRTLLVLLLLPVAAIAAQIPFSNEAEQRFVAIETSVIHLDSPKVTGILPAANGGTGSTVVTQAYVDTTPGGIPAGVILMGGNKSDFHLTQDGLEIFQRDSATQTNAAGAYNGAGTGQKAFVGFNGYSTLSFSDLTVLEFTAKNVYDATTPIGNIFWNLLGNFNTGALTTANDYVNIVVDDAERNRTQYYVLTTTETSYPVDFTEHIFKAVGGTGKVTGTATSVSGSSVITGVTNITALTVGMYFRQTPAATVGTDSTLSNIPIGTTITSIDTGASTLTLSANVGTGVVGFSYVQYGGVAPVSRSVTATSGNPTLTGVANTADLLANMLISGSCVPANTYIVSMVANTSITMSKNASSTGACTVSFVAAGKTGMPNNSDNYGVPWARVVANNPNGYFLNTTPTVAGGWGTADGGFIKNAKHSAFSLIQGNTATTTTRINLLKSATINSDTYTFSR